MTRRFESVTGHALALHEVSAAAPWCEVVFLHGWGDHGARYLSLMQWLADRGVSCLAPDLVGHGVSPGPRARVHDFDVLIRDVRRLIENEARTARPVLWGHSMGGAVAAHVALRFPERVGGVVFDSGALAVNRRIPWWKRLASRALGAALPTLSVGRLKEAAHMTASPEGQQRYLDDALIWHGSIDAGTGRSLLLANEWIERNRDQMRVPFVALMGTEDPLVSLEGPRRLRQASSVPAEVIELDGLRHDLLSELGPEGLARLVEPWLRSTVRPAKDASAGGPS